MVLQFPRPPARIGRFISQGLALSLVLLAPVAFDRAFGQDDFAGRKKEQQASRLTLQDAIDRALAASPGLQAAQAGVAAARGTERQAKLLPNPELSIEVENFKGQGPYRSFDSAEFTYGVSQDVELGGKRSARRNAAMAERQAAELTAESAQLDLIRAVTVAYVEAVAAEQSLVLAQELEKIAKSVLDNVIERVKAAREPETQQSRAEVAYATSLAALQRAGNMRDAKRQALARFWGHGAFPETLSTGDIFLLPAPDALDVYEVRLMQSPDAARFGRIRQAREAELKLARAGIVPDPRVSVGVRQFRHTDDQALVAGVSLPFPVFNQNQGEIARSRAEVLRADAERRQAELDRARQLSEAWSQWQSAWIEAQVLRDRILPQAQKAFRLTLEGYRAGRLSYLEVLDSQRTLFEARAGQVDALTRLHTARADVERLVGAVSAQKQQAKP